MRKLYPESVVAVADTQVGYQEKQNEKYLDEWSYNAGAGNFTKYARDMDAMKFYNNGDGKKKKQGADYCTVFCAWVFKTAGDLNVQELKNAMCVPEGVENLSAGAHYWLEYFKQAGRFYQEPTIGDVVFMTFSADRDADHVGIVSDIGKDGKIYTIEANRSNKVDYYVYPQGHDKILGFGRPRYDQDTSELAAEVNSLREKIKEAVAFLVL